MYYAVPRLLFILALTIIILTTLTGCTGLGTDLGAVAVESGAVVESLSNEVTSINIPLEYVGVVALAAWCIRTPWGLVSDFIGMSRLRSAL